MGSMCKYFHLTMAVKRTLWFANIRHKQRATETKYRFALALLNSKLNDKHK